MPGTHTNITQGNYKLEKHSLANDIRVNAPHTNIHAVEQKVLGSQVVGEQVLDSRVVEQHIQNDGARIVSQELRADEAQVFETKLKSTVETEVIKKVTTPIATNHRHSSRAEDHRASRKDHRHQRCSEDRHSRREGRYDPSTRKGHRQC